LKAHTSIAILNSEIQGTQSASLCWP